MMHAFVPLMREVCRQNSGQLCGRLRLGAIMTTERLGKFDTHLTPSWHEQSCKRSWI